ncbi:MAG: hypothetical protein ABSG04_15295 [Verrucomicrobiota bacterium]|jgi:hypothetical protein
MDLKLRMLSPAEDSQQIDMHLPVSGGRSFAPRRIPAPIRRLFFPLPAPNLSGAFYLSSHNLVCRPVLR